MPLSSLPAEGAAPAVPYLEHLREESARFRELLAGAAGSEHVPTCEEWRADDLLWHLADVQWFWGEIAERGLTSHAEVRGLEARRPAPTCRAVGAARPLRPVDRALQRALAAHDPSTELWMWHLDHSAGYISRRQAHEALIHRIDAELTVGSERGPVDCRLAADGVDEALRVMRGFPVEYALESRPLGPSVTLAVVEGFHHLDRHTGPRDRGGPGRGTFGTSAGWRSLTVRTTPRPPRWPGRPATSTAGCGTGPLTGRSPVAAIPPHWPWSTRWSARP